jgi:hypothetical protein
MEFHYERSPLYLHWSMRDAMRLSNTFAFAPEQRERLIAEILPRPAPDVIATLIEALEGAVAYYKDRNDFERKQSTDSIGRGKVKHLSEQLDKSVEQLDKLGAALKDLDWGTRRELAPFIVGKSRPSLPILKTRKPSEMALFDARACELYSQIAALRGLIGAYFEFVKPKSGPRVRTAREALGVDVADALQMFVPEAVPIVTTAESPFSAILGICFEAAGLKRGDSRRLLMAIVNAFQRADRPQGVKSPPKAI